jgi:hypothetical protein
LIIVLMERAMTSEETGARSTSNQRLSFGLAGDDEEQQPPG